MKVKGNKALYPDILPIEILTATRLKKKYTIEEIAKARSYFNFEKKSPYEITKNSLLTFINSKKLFKDHQFVTRITAKKVESTSTIKKMVNELENKKRELKLLEDYISEFIKAKKDLNQKENAG